MTDSGAVGFSLLEGLVRDKEYYYLNELILAITGTIPSTAYFQNLASRHHKTKRYRAPWGLSGGGC